VQEVSFLLASGAKTRGCLFTPNACGADGCPGIGITTGSIQGYQELYFWAAEGLAEAGYRVLAYDVQGQGRGETFPHSPDGMFACTAAGCEGVPFPQAYNFYQGTRDALDFLLSTPTAPYAHGPAFSGNGANAEGTNAFHPLHADLDRSRIGLAGHSLGAGAVSFVGQERACDPQLAFEDRNGCVSAIVGWDAASAPSGVPADEARELRRRGSGRHASSRLPIGGAARSVTRRSAAPGGRTFEAGASGWPESNDRASPCLSLRAPGARPDECGPRDRSTRRG
jgi:hypothetical protein